MNDNTEKKLSDSPELFSQHSDSFRPLADRLRPQRLDEMVGQAHLLGSGKALRRIIEGDQLGSMILWGPPGTGKTTLARLIAHQTRSEYYSLSAVTSGVSDLRRVIATAEKHQQQGLRTILFVDEIHRFNKSQQDALLHSVEDGTLVLIGATTENPSFEVISALLSRCRVYRLEPLLLEELAQILQRALTVDPWLQKMAVTVEEEARLILLKCAAGDARIVLNGLELAVQLAQPDEKGWRLVTRALIEEALQRPTQLYDKSGEYHYDTISAFIKSVRGSDPDAAIYWLALMLNAGEDPLFVARRLLVLASEDIGNADPHALMVATSAFTATHYLGMPEARIILAQATTYLASAPKSNASYLAIDQALEQVRSETPGVVPLHLRNAPTRLMKEFGYADGYKYPHDFGGFVEQDYLPLPLKNQVYYHPTENGIEKKIKERLHSLWPKKKR